MLNIDFSIKEVACKFGSSQPSSIAFCLKTVPRYGANILTAIESKVAISLTKSIVSKTKSLVS